MSEGLRKLRAGNFNSMKQENLPDGSVLITLAGRKYLEVYKFRVRDLYKPTEQELDVETGAPLPPEESHDD